MRSSWKLVGAIALLAVAAGCETTQPLQLSEQRFTFQVEGLSGSLGSYNVYDMYEDLDNNGVQDLPQEATYFYCERLTNEVQGPSSSPYGYTVQASILRAGATVWEEVTSNDALGTDANLTLYDGNPSPLSAPTKNPITIDDAGEMRTFRFGTAPDERRVLSGANRDVVSSTSNPLNDFDPVTYPLGDGLCSDQDPGDARIDNQPMPLNLTLLKGDSLKVELRRATVSPDGLDYNVEPQLRMRLLLDGREVTVEGSTLTTNQPGSDASFTYTFR